MFRAALRSLFARKVRLLLTGLSVVLGVGFMAGTYVLTDSMSQAFNDLVAQSYAPVDVLVRHENTFTAMSSTMEERNPMPDTVLDEVAAVPGVASAYGDVIGYAQIVDPETGKAIGSMGPPTAASAWYALNGFTLKPGGSPPHGPNEVVIDAGTAKAHHIEVGDTVEILFDGPPQDFEVVGIAGFGEADNLMGATWATFDLPTAQQVLGREGQLDSVAVTAADGVSNADLQRSIAAVLPRGVEAVTNDTVVGEAQDSISTGLGFLQTAFLVFAFIALFVGAFIIFNTFAITVAQRTRELALFRAVGATGRQVMASVMVEAFVIGLVAAALGVGAGIVIAIGLRAILSAVGFDIPTSDLVIASRTVVVSMVIGTLVTVLAAAVPARRAARIAPIQALREGQDEASRSLHFRITAGAVVLFLGVAPLLYGLFGSSGEGIQLVGVGVMLTFIGIAMLTPLIARPMARVLGMPLRSMGVPGKLARENAMRNPRRTAATASALMVGLGLVVLVAVFGASAKATTSKLLGETLKADLVLTSPSFSGFSTSAADAVRGVAGVATASELREGEVHVNGGTTLITGLDPASVSDVLEVKPTAGSLVELSRPNTVAVFEGVAEDNGWEVGQNVEVTFPASGPANLQLVAIYQPSQMLDDYSVSLDTYDANVARIQDMFVLVKAESGAEIGAVRTAVENALSEYPNVQVQDQGSLAAKYASLVDQILNMITALLLFAVVIALFGVMNTLYLSIYERTHELGLLRAVGLTRRQTRSMVRQEAGIISVMGALFGVVVGIAFGWALQQALASRGFSVFSVPGGQLAFYVILAAVLGWLFAFLPARRAAKLNVLESIARE